MRNCPSHRAVQWYCPAGSNVWTLFFKTWVTSWCYQPLLPQEKQWGGWVVTAYPENKGAMILFVLSSVLLSHAKEIWFRPEMHKKLYALEEEFDQSYSEVFVSFPPPFPSCLWCPLCRWAWAGRAETQAHFVSGWQIAMEEDPRRTWGQRGNHGSKIKKHLFALWRLKWERVKILPKQKAASERICEHIIGWITVKGNSLQIICVKWQDL